MQTRLRERPAGIAALMMILYAFSNGIQYIGYTHVPLFISRQSFAVDSTIGYATAIGAVATILGQLFWGRVSDRSKSKNVVLACALLGLGLTALLFLRDMPSVSVLYLAMPIFYFFFLAPQSMADTICTENISLTGKPFGIIRAGSPAFSTTLALSMMLFPSISVTAMIAVLVICPLIAIFPALLLPRTEGHDRGKKHTRKQSPVLPLLRDRRMLLLLAFGLFGFTFGNIATTYFSVYYGTERGLNAGNGLIGAFFAIAIASEAVLLLFGTERISRMGPFRALAAILVTNAARMFLTWLIRDKYLMLVTAFLQAAWFATIWGVVAPLINTIAPPEARATAQSLWVLTAFGISQLTGNLLAGILADIMPMRSIFLVSACGYAALFAVIGPMLLREAGRNQPPCRT